MFMYETGHSWFGELAVELGYLHRDHLQQALVVQQELARCGIPVSIEVILVELRYMTRTEAEQVGRDALRKDTACVSPIMQRRERRAT